jgi:Holliday junction resolvase
MNTAHKGRRVEWKTRDALEAQGYAVVRAAGSHGVFDLVAIGPKDVRLLQVKANRWPGSDEMEKLRSFRCPAIVSREVWRWDDRMPGPKVRVL